MSVLRVAVAAASVAIAASRHPMVRAGIRAAPLLVTPAMRQQASEAALNAAYRAGALARRLTGK